MLFHQPRTLTDDEQTSYVSTDLPMRRTRPDGYAERLGLRKPSAGAANSIKGGVTASGTQSLVFQFPVRPFNSTEIDA